MGEGGQGQPPEPGGHGDRHSGVRQEGKHNRSNVELALYQVRNILSSLSTELDQALVQCRLATSERRCAKAALCSQSSQLKKRAIHETKNELSTQETPHVLLPSQSSCSVLIVHLNHPALFRLPTGLETLQSGTWVSSSPPAGSERALPSPLPLRFSAIPQLGKTSGDTKPRVNGFIHETL